ncbi:MAG: 4-hydroxybutyrate coenzyme A transferase, partial [Rhodospirillaceae bacterium]|nr:4-hydroxybutyrate coenzyme A transferase [Rhodospirillaceae bacterium]
ITGHGGLVDFVRGANASEGGRSIIALPSTAGKGRSSRIVPRLCPSRPVTLARSDVQWVVTEHGAANLALADTEQRAERLLDVADPAFRDWLADGWTALCNRRAHA